MFKKLLIFIVFFFPLADIYANYNNFYYGHCTRYVAKEKNVDWTGNAKDWLNNAKNIWHTIGQNAIKGSIIVFNGPRYSNYWHVAIVENIIWNYLIISEMNYDKLNKINYRKINKYDVNIIWFIYY